MLNSSENEKRLASKLEGGWIVQSTSYPSSLKTEVKNTFISQIKWAHIENHDPHLGSTKARLEEEYGLNDVSLYQVTYNSNASSFINYVLMIYSASKLNFVIKFDHEFKISNKFIVQNQSKDQLTFISFTNSAKIIEKIYFLNSNLKIVKSTIYRRNSYIATFFSSEIRIF